MTQLQVRRPRFDFTDEVAFAWNPQNPAFSLNMNATSILAICFEQMIVAAVQEAKPLITDPEVAAEATAFLRQEAQHSSSHRKHVSALIEHYPGLQETLDQTIASYDHLTATTPLAFRLAYVADLEATFTPSFKMMLDHEDTLFRPGDDRVASLFLWHFVEEVEHRSSALIIYDSVVGSDSYRVKVLPRVVKHLLSVMKIVVEGFNAHVPFDERRVDARVLLPDHGFRQTLRKLPLRGRPTGPRVPASFASVPWKQKLIAAGGVLRSQLPSHKPAGERLPEFADRWFARYEQGGDVTRWYSTENVG